MSLSASITPNNYSVRFESPHPFIRQPHNYYFTLPAHPSPIAGIYNTYTLQLQCHVYNRLKRHAFRRSLNDIFPLTYSLSSSVSFPRFG
jgi:hypothetical protein